MSRKKGNLNVKLNINVIISVNQDREYPQSSVKSLNLKVRRFVYRVLPSIGLQGAPAGVVFEIPPT